MSQDPGCEKRQRCKSSIRYGLLTDANSHIHHLSRNKSNLSRAQTKLKEGFQSSSQTKFTPPHLIFMNFMFLGIMEPSWLHPPPRSRCSTVKNVCVAVYDKTRIEFVTMLQHREPPGRWHNSKLLSIGILCISVSPAEDKLPFKPVCKRLVQHLILYRGGGGDDLRSAFLLSWWQFQS